MARSTTTSTCNSNSSDPSMKGRISITDESSNDSTALEENESPDLYSSITVTENPFGASVWDHYEKVRLLDDGGTGELWLVSKKCNNNNNNNNSSKDQPPPPQSQKGDGDDGNDDEGGVPEYFVVKCIDKNFLFGIFSKELRNEFDNLRQIDHPHIVRIYETFETRNDMFLVMEYCSGGDLYARLPCTEAEAARILLQVLSAVAYCHKQKIVHRDIKMENILWETTDVDSHIKMIDFGYAQHYRRPRGDYTMKMDIGTTYTMSPQVIEGKYTEKCDLWSVGVIAFMLLSGGTRPFDADEDKEIRPKIKEGIYHMKAPQWDTVSDEAKAFVKSLLEYDPDKRPSAEEATQSKWLQRYATQSEDTVDDTLMDTVHSALLSSTEESKLKRLSMMIVAHSAASEKLHELGEVFDALDHSNDGTINFSEFADAMQHYDISQEELAELFGELDQNNTGVINYTEFLSAVLESTGQVEEDLIEEAFDKLDVHNAGEIDKDGLTSVLEETNTPSNECEQKAEELLLEVSGSSNGKVSYEEFSSMFEGIDEESSKPANFETS